MKLVMRTRRVSPLGSTASNCTSEPLVGSIQTLARVNAGVLRLGRQQDHVRLAVADGRRAAVTNRVAVLRVGEELADQVERTRLVAATWQPRLTRPGVDVGRYAHT